MSWAADGQDGNGLHLEKIEATFLTFIASVSENSLKFWLWFIFSWKFTWYLPFSVPLVFCVRQRHVVLIWGHFDPKTWKSPWRSPCKSSYFGENDCFYQLFLKKPCWPKHTALGRFSQNNAISQSKHTVLSSLRKNIDAIGNKTENSRVPSYRGSVTAISVTLKNPKTYLYQWKPKNKGLLLFKIIPLVL